MSQRTISTLIILALIAVGAWWGIKYTKGKSLGSTAYQAVFLSNGQVYFGMVDDENSDPVVVKDIYYLRVQKQLQPAAEGEGDKPQIQLVKLGEELHGPKDEMRINKEHILFIEDMKDDSKVVQAIEESKKQEKKKE